MAERPLLKTHCHRSIVLSRYNSRLFVMLLKMNICGIVAITDESRIRYFFSFFLLIILILFNYLLFGDYSGMHYCEFLYLLHKFNDTLKSAHD